MAESVPGAKRALKILDAGGKVAASDLADLQYVESRLGLKRALSSYAPRTRRRHLATALAGQPAGASSRSDYQKRKTTIFNRWHMTPFQYRQFSPLRNKILESGVDIGYMLEPEPVRDIIDMYGFAYVKTVLTNQVDSIEEYTRGNTGPGNRRWHSRGELEADAQARTKNAFAVMFVSGTDPYYYYHGSLK